jgi:outer membrane protein OmpA-like peptidoglycan-associated protein/opacity protein-like surface antigen
MTQRLPSSLLLGCAALLLFASAASAQVVRPSETLYLALKGYATTYGGELDGTSSANGDKYDWLFSDFGWAVGAELGYQFSDNLGFGVTGLYGRYSNINEPNGFAVGIGGGQQINDSESFIEIHPLFRYMPFPGGKITPFIELGGGIALYQETGNDNRDATNTPKTSYGPTLGLGLDLLLGKQLSFFLGAQGSLWFPDDGFDGSNPGGLGLPFADEADFDATMKYGGGFRYFFRPPYTEVDATIDCTTDLIVGESGSFTAMINQDASEPLSFMWNWGDGTTSSGMTASHAYSAPGTYTVSFTAEGPANSDTETCLVTVMEPQIAPALSACRVSPSRANMGQEVTVSANVNSDVSEPYEISVDFGDGTTANSLPARHTYGDAGTYTVTITATNAYGSDTCTVTVNVGDTFCDEVTELNTVYFEYGMSALTAEGRSRLDENLEVLRRCPDICVVINAYADDSESDKLRLSERRAEEVKAYYVANGIDESRILARGLGEAPDSDSKSDPDRGDRNARRAESIPVDCDRMDDMGDGM